MRGVIPGTCADCLMLHVRMPPGDARRPPARHTHQLSPAQCPATGPDHSSAFPSPGHFGDGVPALRETAVSLQGLLFPSNPMILLVPFFPPSQSPPLIPSALSEKRIKGNEEK